MNPTRIDHFSNDSSINLSIASYSVGPCSAGNEKRFVHFFKIQRKMELSNLSKSVLRFGNNSIPAVGFGTYLLKGDQGLLALKHAIKTGYRLLDTAHLYQNEDLVGQAVR